MGKIKFFVMDVDGTLTDGKIYICNTGEMFKAFDVKDGYGIHDILPQNNIIPIIITARESLIVETRCRELGINEIHQGCRVKIDKLYEILEYYVKKDKISYDLSNVAYIGDDVLDIQCIIPIRQKGGITACPADAIFEVKSSVDYICSKNAGFGAVREFISHIIDHVIK